MLMYIVKVSLNDCNYSDHKVLFVQICPDKQTKVNNWIVNVFRSLNREAFVDKLKEQVEHLLSIEHKITVENLVSSIVKCKADTTTWNSPDVVTKNEIDHVLYYIRHASSS
ncbi:hypothetical protein ACFFRR_001059 [Megaselia abdita]